MASLTYNEKTKDYIFIAGNSNDDDKASQVGLTLSKTARTQAGQHVYFTKVPYAALAFWDVADQRAKDKLQALHRDFVGSNAITSDKTYTAPKGLAYMPYQNAGITYGLQHDNVLIGDEPGLGKSGQSIGIANERKSAKNLVICPASIRLNWQREIRKWSAIPNVTTYPVLKSGNGISPDANYVILSYELARNEGLHDALCSMKWDNLILDEAHYLKTPEAIRTRAIFGGGRGQFAENIMAERCENIITLTGTPLPNRPRECLEGSVRVLTNRGWVPIIEVKMTDLVWDGEEWVEHQGLLFQGYAKTVNVAGISATETHRFLGKNSWVSAAEACQNSDIVLRMLERGSANLPSSVYDSQSKKQSSVYESYATAALKNLKQRFSVFASGVQPSAVRVGPSSVATKRWLSTSASVLTTKTVEDCLPFLDMPFSVATTQTMPITNLTAAGVFTFMNFGERIAQVFSATSFHLQVSMTRLYNWIGSITRKVTNRETYVGQPEKKTWETAEKFTKCNNESSTLKPVYDLANAGPRQRFTVLSDFGPVISHNCYTLARALNWEAIDWLSYEAFCMRFNPSGMMENGAVIEKKGRLPELQHRLRCNFMVRRLKKDVLTDLPDKRYEFSYVEPNGKIREALAKERLIHFSVSDLKDPHAELWGQIATIRREMGVAKIPRIVEHMKYLLEIEELPKIVMFSHHKEVMDQLAHELSAYGIVQVRGGMGANAKQASVDAFVQNPRVRVFSGQLDAAGFGIDGLQDVCQRVVFAEPAWTPGTNEQAADRIHRIGQHGNVLAQFLIVEGSLDERVLAAVLNKAHTIHDSLDKQHF